jgi:flagellar L-ring protein FlgH
MKTAAVSLLALTLAACSATQEIGREPTLSPVGYGVTPGKISAHHYPTPAAQTPRRFSLWDDGQSRLFTDPRAFRTGDILTVAILINDKAQFRNESERRRSSTRDIGGSFGVSLPILEGQGDATAEIGGGSTSAGRGATARSEEIRLQIAAVVSEVLPNGNLVIVGSQEVRVNAELRILTIEGIVRPSDIGTSNTISYERIAEARISYGGRGRLTEVQQPAYGQQFLDNVLPF